MKPIRRQKNSYEVQRVQNLLKEYEICTIDANHLEDSIWTVTGILITATVAGIGFLGSSAPKSIYDLSVRIGVAILAIMIVGVWYKIVTRWYSIQQVIYFRTKEIEPNLGMYKNRYVSYLDDHIQNIASQHSPHFPSLLAELGKAHRGRNHKKSIKAIRMVLILSWTFFGALQVVSVLPFITKFHVIK